MIHRIDELLLPTALSHLSPPSAPAAFFFRVALCVLGSVSTEKSNCLGSNLPPDWSTSVSRLATTDGRPEETVPEEEVVLAAVGERVVVAGEDFSGRAGGGGGGGAWGNWYWSAGSPAKVAEGSRSYVNPPV